MIDTLLEGKALFALSTLLFTPLAMPPFSQIINNSFVGITKQQTADDLDDMGYSYFFKATQKTFAYGLWFGLQQAKAVLTDAIVEYNIREALSGLVDRGLSYSNSTADQIEGSINGVLALMQSAGLINGLKSIEITPFSGQQVANKRKGIYAGVTVIYLYGIEVRRIDINLQKEI